MRPNFFVNTPDILSQYLPHAGPHAFAVRSVLAAMMSPSWGVYAGYELGEMCRWCLAARSTWIRRSTPTGRGIGPGASRPRPGAVLTRLNAIRRAHPALH